MRPAINNVPMKKLQFVRNKIVNFLARAFPNIHPNIRIQSSLLGWVKPWGKNSPLLPILSDSRSISNKASHCRRRKPSKYSLHLGRDLKRGNFTLVILANPRRETLSNTNIARGSIVFFSGDNSTQNLKKNGNLDIHQVTSISYANLATKWWHSLATALISAPCEPVFRCAFKKNKYQTLSIENTNYNRKI